jgi:hypothetical protein
MFGRMIRACKRIRRGLRFARTGPQTRRDNRGILFFRHGLENSQEKAEKMQKVRVARRNRLPECSP